MGLLEPMSVLQSTSRAAAREIIPHLSTLQIEVFSLILEEPRTCDEIEHVSGMRHQTASARVHELNRRGFISPSGVERPTRSGRKAIVWKVQPKQAELPF